jgi:hypothetical protein
VQLRETEFKSSEIVTGNPRKNVQKLSNRLEGNNKYDIMMVNMKNERILREKNDQSGDTQDFQSSDCHPIMTIRNYG